MRAFLRWLIRFVIDLIARVEIQGFENIPKEGGFVIATNHLGRLDVALLFYTLEGDFILPVAEKYEHHWLFGPIGNAMGGIWLDRFNADVGSIREILARMKAGGILVIAPEGTRSKSEAMAEGKPGVAYLAMKAEVPIVPIALAGTEDRLVVDRLRHLKKSEIKIVVGPSFRLPPVKGRDRDAALKQYTDEIMCRIGILLPEKYRGVYAEHPRLKELLT
ncbi:MAG: 1-acyl-sn-glycerol-3-phosphate acyltransferase [Anaerolineales bacterium]|nr:1-acyl-sn-glycerol-3-phosphate acyltransferase [Anaerolineales bacterium]